MTKTLTVVCATCGHPVEADRIMDPTNGSRYPKINRESLLLHMDCDLLLIAIAIDYAATESVPRRTYVAGRLNRNGLDLHPLSKELDV